MSKKVLFGIVAILLIVWFLVSDTMRSVDTDGDTVSTQTSTSTGGIVGTTTPKATVIPKRQLVAQYVSQPVSMSYQKALETYKDSSRIQLSGSDFCQVSPNTVTYKNGTSIMIDNRSPKTRTIKIGAIGTHTIEGYGFKVIKLSGTALPATLLADCDTQQNVAKITLQK